MRPIAFVGYPAADWPFTKGKKYKLDMGHQEIRYIAIGANDEEAVKTVNLADFKLGDTRLIDAVRHSINHRLIDGLKYTQIFEVTYIVNRYRHRRFEVRHVNQREIRQALKEATKT